MTASPELSLGPGSEGLVLREGSCSLGGSPGTNTEQGASRGGDRQVGQDHGCLLWVTLSQINTRLHAQLLTWQQRHPAASHSSHPSQAVPRYPQGLTAISEPPEMLRKVASSLPLPLSPQPDRPPSLCVLSPRAPRGSYGKVVQDRHVCIQSTEA